MCVTYVIVFKEIFSPGYDIVIITEAVYCIT